MNGRESWTENGGEGNSFFWRNVGLGGVKGIFGGLVGFVGVFVEMRVNLTLGWIECMYNAITLSE